MQTSQRAPKAVLIDDDFELLNLIEEGLSGAGFEVSRFSSAQDALQSEENFNADMVLCDLHIEKPFAGLDVLEMLKRSHADIPALYMTSGSRDVSEDEFLALGAKRFFSKPVRISSLIEKCLQDLSSPPEESSLNASSPSTNN